MAMPPRRTRVLIVDQPFRKLNERKWLHGRSENDTFKLLLDTHRLRVMDDYDAYVNRRAHLHHIDSFAGQATSKSASSVTKA